MWSFLATSSTCKQENTSCHAFTTVKSHHNGIQGQNPAHYSQQIKMLFTAADWDQSIFWRSFLLFHSSVHECGRIFFWQLRNFENFTLYLTYGNIIFLIAVNKICEQRRKAYNLAQWNKFFEYMMILWCLESYEICTRRRLVQILKLFYTSLVPINQEMHSCLYDFPHIPDNFKGIL